MQVSIGNAISASAHSDYANTVAAITMDADDRVTAKGNVNVVEVTSVGKNRSRVALTFTNDGHTARVLREVLWAMGDPGLPVGIRYTPCGAHSPAEDDTAPPTDCVLMWTHMGPHAKANGFTWPSFTPDPPPPPPAPGWAMYRISCHHCVEFANYAERASEAAVIAAEHNSTAHAGAHPSDVNRYARVYCVVPSDLTT